MLELTAFAIRERVKIAETDTYDIYNATSGQKVGVAHERISPAASWGRLFVSKHWFAASIEIAPAEHADPVLCMKRDGGIVPRNIRIETAKGQTLATVHARNFKRGLDIKNGKGEPVAEIRVIGLRGREFEVVDLQGNLIGKISQKWAGLAKELLTTSDDYIVSVEGKSNPRRAALMLGIGMAIDSCFKED